MLTQKVRETFTLLTKKAATQYINAQINERLKSAIGGNVIQVQDSTNPLTRMTPPLTL